MPLDGYSEGMTGKLEGLHDTVRCICYRLETSTYLRDGLVVQAIDFELRSPNYRCQTAAFLNLDSVRKMAPGPSGNLLVCQSRGNLAADICVKIPTQSHICNLEAAADTQERHLQPHGLLYQLELDFVPVCIYLVYSRMSLTSETGWIDITSPGQKKAIYPF
jgi:hypothetical protein